MSHQQDQAAHPSTEVCTDCIPASDIPTQPSHSVDTKTGAAGTIPDGTIRPSTPLKPSITIEFCDRCRWFVPILLIYL